MEKRQFWRWRQDGRRNAPWRDHPQQGGRALDGYQDVLVVGVETDRSTALLLSLWLGLVAPALAKGQIAILTGSKPPALEQLAATELAQGVMVGEVGVDSAILQSRLTSTETLIDRRWSGILGVEGYARFEISVHPDLKDAVRTDWLQAKPENDYIVKLKVTEVSRQRVTHDNPIKIESGMKILTGKVVDGWQLLNEIKDSAW